MFKSKKSFLKLFVIVIVLGGLVFGVNKLWAKKNAVKVQGAPTTNTIQTDLQAPIATQAIDRQIELPLTGSVKPKAGDPGQQLIFMIESAELRKQILVKGQPQTAAPGRLFLIFNLKLTNSLDKGLNINTRDYVRLSINGSSEKLAPDIHNDPVEVQAISTKYTRLGFPVSETDKQFTIQLGDIKGEKVEIPLQF